MEKRRKQVNVDAKFLTPTERWTQRILTFFYKSVFWFLLPLVVVLFLVDGFHFSVLLVLAIVLFIFVPIYKQNEKRLETLAKIRKDNAEKTEAHDFSASEEKGLRAISMNAGMGSFYVTICSFFITVLFVWSHGWGAALTKFFLFLTILFLGVSIWLPYSPFLKRSISFTNERIQIGKRTLYRGEIREIEYDEKNGVVNCYLTYTNEPVKLLIEKEDRSSAEEMLRSWCRREGVVFKGSSD